MVDPLWHAAFYRPEKRMVTPTRKRAGLTAAGMAALLAAMPIILPGLTRLEAGKDRGAPYRDTLAKGAPWTVCDGKLIDTPRRYTNAECDRLTAEQVLTVYGPGAIGCVPSLGLPERRNQLIASVWLAWNIGVHRFCTSTAARRFNVGEWRRGCEAFALFNKSNGIIRPGLINRRNFEMRRCTEGFV